MSTSYLISLFSLPFYHVKIDIFLRFYDFLLALMHILRWKGLSRQELLRCYHSHIEMNCRLVPSEFTSNPPLYGSDRFTDSLPILIKCFSFPPAFSSPDSLSISSFDILRIFLFGFVISVVFCCLYTSMTLSICQPIFRHFSYFSIIILMPLNCIYN